ncbi:MAG: uroporphyrinogen-III decarboxylase-like protein [bacterium]|nr:uroporphyrinogen-III decarboxylase-like protein [bacterium]
MNSRERLLAILDRRPVDRMPVDLWYTPEIYTALAGHFGVQEPTALWKALGLDKLAWVNAPYKGPRAPFGEGEAVNEWGVRTKTVQAGMAEYGERTTPPLAGFDTPEAVADYAWWPDPDQFDYDWAVRYARSVNGDFLTLGPWVSFFEIYCAMRGLEQSLIDVLIAPDLVDAVLDRIEECQTAMIRRFLDRAQGAVDLMFLSDDMGSQKNLLVSLETWDRFFKDRMKRWCDLAHSYGVKVFYHTDGAAGELVPRLIEAGIDVLNPIQHVCPSMEMAVLKQRYGGRIIFHGGVENQSVLPFGTADDVRRETLDCLRTLGAGGQGYIACSCHNVQAGTPVGNVLAMVETVRNWKW